MSQKGFNPEYKKAHNLRFQRTYDFMKDLLSDDDRILDLGPENPFSEFLLEKGYKIDNTPAGSDLDLKYDMVKDGKYNVLTAFEIFEHLVSPFPLLYHSKAEKLIASVPLKLWFSSAYWSENDPYDRHYHEFEPRQFDMLLEKAGWQIVKRQKWSSKSFSLGIRPILRRFTPRHYIVYCERNKNI